MKLYFSVGSLVRELTCKNDSSRKLHHTDLKTLQISILWFQLIKVGKIINLIILQLIDNKPYKPSIYTKQLL